MIKNCKMIRVYDNFLSQEECKSLIAHFEEAQKEKKVKYIDRGIAEYFRLEEDSERMASNLWNRLEKTLPKEYNGKPIKCLNTHFRYSKYEPGMEFSIHRDGMNQDKNGYRSALTLNIFLNDDFKGGETDFFDDNKNLLLSAKPSPGKAALFDTEVLHRGNKVLDGCKYLLRTDVMIDTS